MKYWKKCEFHPTTSEYLEHHGKSENIPILTNCEILKYGVCLEDTCPIMELREEVRRLWEENKKLDLDIKATMSTACGTVKDVANLIKAKDCMGKLEGKEKK